MTLGELQRQFTRDIGELILYAYGLGYELTFGEAYRTPEQAALNAAKGSGIANSLHTMRLAVDFNLFVGGQYQASTEAHRQLGEFWEALREGNCWGGRFGDGNHYSRSYQGRR